MHTACGAFSMKTRVLHTKLWKDKWFVDLSKDAKFLWLYLLTNDKINISGVYELSDREILFDTSIDTSMLGVLKEQLKPKAVFFEGWVKILNVDRYNMYRNSPLNETAYIRELTYIPVPVKEHFQIFTDTSIHTSIYTPINKKSEIINHKSEISRELFEKKRKELQDKRII